jgi:hypothetical protein
MRSSGRCGSRIATARRGGRSIGLLSRRLGGCAGAEYTWSTRHFTALAKAASRGAPAGDTGRVPHEGFLSSDESAVLLTSQSTP